MLKKNKFMLFLFVVLLSIICAGLSSAQSQFEIEDSNNLNNNSIICAVYITGIGCPNCAATDPFLLNELTAKYPGLVIIEYEIYRSFSSNSDVSNEYFKNYAVGRPGIPFLIFSKDQTAAGKFAVLNAENIISSIGQNKCPMPDGSSVDFKDLDITTLQGRPVIWTKDRILIQVSQESSQAGNNEVLKNLLTAENIPSALEDIEYTEADSVPVIFSGSEIKFNNAVKIGDNIIQWDKGSGFLCSVNAAYRFVLDNIYLLLFIVIMLCVLLYSIYKAKKGTKFKLNELQTDFLIIGAAIIFLAGFFVLAKRVSPEFLEQIGCSLPLPVFTFLIALVDGFNPCNIFVLTFLLALLFSVSHSRKRIYTIGFTFIFVVFLIYFLFMAAWLNIFQYIGFITPLRITLAALAIIAGMINCKELLFFRKGVTLMIQEQHKIPLVKRIEKVKDIAKTGTLPLLIISSVGLAAFASLIELPCTAGFPIIYTGILSARALSNFSYYLYLLFYNVIYVVPLLVIITILGQTMKEKRISKRQMQIIKFVGGIIMLMLGIILLINPGLIGVI